MSALTTLDQVLYMMQAGNAWLWTLQAKPAGAKAFKVGEYMIEGTPNPDASKNHLFSITSNFEGQEMIISPRRHIKSNAGGVLGDIPFYVPPTGPGAMNGLAGMNNRPPYGGGQFMQQQMGGYYDPQLGQMLPMSIINEKDSLSRRESQLMIDRAMFEQEKKNWEERKKEKEEELKELEKTYTSHSEKVSAGVIKSLGHFVDFQLGPQKDGIPSSLAGGKPAAPAAPSEQESDAEQTPTEKAIEAFAYRILEAELSDDAIDLVVTLGGMLAKRAELIVELNHKDQALKDVARVLVTHSKKSEE